jgi:hypothetical protein
MSFMMLETRALREMVAIQAKTRFAGRKVDAAAVLHRVEARGSA